MQRIRPFHVMELLRRANELAANGRDIVHMEIGEPDFPTVGPVLEAGIEALRAGHTGYLPAAGLPALREAISAHYQRWYGVAPPPERIFITPGASGALVVALALVTNPGAGVLLPDPGYPCNRNFVELVDGKPIAVPVGPEDNYQLTGSAISQYADADTAAAVIGSPSNPTGTLAGAAALGAAATAARLRGTALIVDEIYHGLHYEPEIAGAIREAPEAFIVNSFSKYFGMTGWRLGWLVVPPGYESAAERLIQNLFISASTPAQHAALACFTDAATEMFEMRRTAFRDRRDALLPALRDLGFRIPGTPAGAFYLYADSSSLAEDSFALASDLLERTGVAITPGVDFEITAPEKRVRFAYTTGLDRLTEAVDRMYGYFRAGR
jgi:aspartate/methionine/tyrosine aminotransferase